MATKFESWNDFLSCVHPDAYRNGEVDIEEKARFIVESREARVEPISNPAERETIILGGETINTPIYFRDLAILLAEYNHRVHFVNLPSEARNIDDAAAQTRDRIRSIYANTELPIRILGQSMGGYILALLAFHHGFFDSNPVESLHFDAPALTGKIYKLRDAYRFNAKCKESSDHGLLTKGKKLSPAAYQSIFGCSPEEAEVISLTSQKTSGFVPALATRGLIGKHKEIKFVPQVPMYVTSRPEDLVLNHSLLLKRIEEYRKAGANITLQEPTESSRHLHLQGMTRDQITKAFFSLI
jgi:pimeloyl-ACP methyl ester carboxylesterase